MGEKPFISIGETYFHRFQSSKSHILTPPDALVKLIVVIPSFNEPKLIESVKSLCVCDIPKNCAIEIIVVVNHPLDASSTIVELSKQNSSRKIFSCKEMTFLNLFLHYKGTSA